MTLFIVLAVGVAGLPVMESAEAESEETRAVVEPGLLEVGGSADTAMPEIPSESFDVLPPRPGEVVEPLAVDPEGVEPVQELVELRTATSETWVNRNGSRTTNVFGEPKYFDVGDGRFEPIDSSVVPAEGRKGWFRNAANSWSVNFGPIESDQIAAVEISYGAERVGFSPRRPATKEVIVPAVVEGGVVQYRDVWPGVDLEYRVLATGVKEDIVVRAPGTGSRFEFSVFGTNFAPKRQLSPAGGELLTSDGGGLMIAQAEVTTDDGSPIDVRSSVATAPSGTALAAPSGTSSAAPEPDATEPTSEEQSTVSGRGPPMAPAQVVAVEVDGKWLSGLQSDKLPVRIDPTVVIGAAAWQAYTHTGYSCGAPCQARVGNSRYLGDLYWQSVEYYPYESLIDNNQKVVSATLNLSRTEGTTTSQPVDVGWASAWSFAGASPGNGWVRSQWVTDNAAVDVTDLYGHWVHNGIRGGAIGYAGDNWPGQYTYKQFQVSLSIVYTNPPPAPTAVAPDDGTVLTTTTPTLSVNPVSDPDGDPVYYLYRVSTSPDAGEGGSVVNSGIAGTSWTVPTGSLRDGQTYYWRAWTWDGQTLASVIPSGWIRKFKIDQRLGSGGPSPADTVGPVGVNLATGNLSTSASTPSVATVGGSLGVTLTYNSQQARSSGLTGSYQRDLNANRLFDEAPVVQREDPQVAFNWGTASPSWALGGDDFLARWTGWITLPPGTWELGAAADDGVRIYVDSQPVLDRWVVQALGPPVYSTTGLAGSTTRRIQVDYYEATGNAGIELWARPVGGSGFIVPASWLSVEPTTMPTGWTASIGDDDISYVSARIDANAVVVRAADGSSIEYTRTTGATPGFTPPAGHDDVLAANPDGTYTLSADDAKIYTFDATGQLTTVTSTADDRKPAAITYTITMVAGLPRVTSMTDPVSQRSVTLSYSTGQTGSCPADATPVPTGLLCKADFSAFELGASELLYVNGQLSQLINPGGATTTFGYDTNGRLNALRDSLAHDAVAAGVRGATGDPVTTDISYDTSGRATSVTAPAPSIGALRPQHTYTYGAFTTSVTTAGITGTRTVTFDTAARGLTDTDPTGVQSSSSWDVADRPTASTDGAGVRSITRYDHAGRPIEQWGPAASGATNWGSDGFTPNASLVPVTTTSYDGGINGLASTWWASANFNGAPRQHATGTRLNPGGELDATWSSAPSGLANQWSVRFIGEITLPQAGQYVLAAWSTGQVRIYVDDQLLADTGTDPAVNTRSPDAVVQNPTAGAKRRLRVDMSESNGTNGAAILALHWAPPSGGGYAVPGTHLAPRYGLVTQTTAPADNPGAPNVATTTGYTATNGLGPEHGLATTSTVDPGGLALTSTTSYETPGAGYLRRTNKTLPSGAASTTTDTYYGDTESRTNPCPGGAAANQAGRLKLASDADPDGSGPATAVVRESIYDAAGRTVAARTGPVNTGDWTCTSFDSRGRATSVAYPAFGGNPARTVTSNYAVGANPLVTSITDPAGTITTTVDLLGRTVGYTDVWGRTTTTTYDQAGRVTTTTTTGAATLGYTYDDAGRVETVSGNSLLIADPVYETTPNTRRLMRVDYPSGSGKAGNSTRGDFTYDTFAGRPQKVTWTSQPSGTLITSDEINQRGPSGNIANRFTDGVDPDPANPNYVYDTAGRLTTARVPGRTLTYDFAATSSTCTAPNAGRNTNRVSQTVAGGGTSLYCYDHADRLVSSTDTAVGTVSHDAHGNATSIFGETHGYDAADRHLTTMKGSTTITYVRDATDRIVERRLNGAVTARYANTGSGDTPEVTIDSSGNVIEQTVVLPGGAMVTTRSTGAVWSYPDLSGNVVAVANAVGAKQGSTVVYDPYGQIVSGNLPDNSPGAFDYGWLGQHQRPLEHETGLEAVVEMGQRQYSPRLGRFIELDPVEGGSANDYDYVSADPVNNTDLDGRVCVLGKNPNGSCRGSGVVKTVKKRVRSMVENGCGRGVGTRVSSGRCGAGLAGPVCRAARSSYSPSAANWPNVIVGGATEATGRWWMKAFSGNRPRVAATSFSRFTAQATVIATAVDVSCRARGW